LLDIPYVENYKYLGVCISKNLKISVQLEKIEEKLKKYEKMSFILRY
jgi:hypothetical protein